MHGINWGTVPTWISSILTSGSLLLGFYILLRDRRKEERSQAALVVCWNDYRDDSEYVKIFNTSNRPVTNISVHAHPYPYRSGPYDKKVALTFEGFSVQAFLMPKEECESNSFPIHPKKNRWHPEYVTFEDADGRQWVRFLSSGVLVRGPWRSDLSYTKRTQEIQGQWKRKESATRMSSSRERTRSRWRLIKWL